MRNHQTVHWRAFGQGHRLSAFTAELLVLEVCFVLYDASTKGQYASILYEPGHASRDYI